MLAGLRTASNDATRAADRDRGVAKNRLADIQGAAGELIAIRRFEAVEEAVLSHNLFDAAGAVNDVDLVAALPETVLRLEAKCHLDDDHKKLLLVNQRAHERSRARSADGYLPVLATIKGTLACTGRVIALEDLDNWRVMTWPSRPEQDPALAAPLEAVAEKCFATSFASIRAMIRPTFEGLDLEADYERGRQRFREGVRPRFDELAAVEARDLLLELL